MKRERFLVTRWAVGGALIACAWLTAACGGEAADTATETLVPTAAQESRSDMTAQVVQIRTTSVPESPTPLLKSGNETAPSTVMTRPAPPTATLFPRASSERATAGLPARILTGQSGPPDRDLAELASRLRGATVSQPPTEPTLPLSKGALEEFWVTDMDDGTAHRITATLRVVSDNVYWFVDNAVHVDQGSLEEAAEQFEERLRPTVVGTFGDIRRPGIDGDPRLVVLHSVLDGAAGYFGSHDSFPTEVHPHSNEREIIYIDSDDIPAGSDLYMGVIAHELQHAVHFNHDDGEESWVNEGLSEVATGVAGYEAGSPRLFLRRPTTQLNYWPDEPGRRPPHYGASALFFTYLAQRVGGAQNLLALAAEPLDGIAGVDSFLNDHGLTFAEVFADWTVANYLDSDDDRYGYQGQDIRVGAVRDLRAGPGRRERLPQFAARYYEIHTDSLSAAIEFNGDTEVRQVRVDCIQGPTCWWSGRGDGIDTKLTREFDLTGLQKATLEFAVWYDIEEGWDYGYIEVSDDDGRSWSILEGEHTSAENPSGNAYGPGYTGSSRSWRRESIDLTPFVGGPVMIRFEYITDDAVYLDGLLIDDVSIPEIEFHDDPRDTDGWQADGFGLAGNPLVQEFVVQVVETAPDRSFRVSRLNLDDQNRGAMTLTGLGSEVESVVVVVSPTTDGTRHSAGYVLELAE